MKALKLILSIAGIILVIRGIWFILNYSNWYAMQLNTIYLPSCATSQKTIEACLIVISQHAGIREAAMYFEVVMGIMLLSWAFTLRSVKIVWNYY